MAVGGGVAGKRGATFGVEAYNTKRGTKHISGRLGAMRLFDDAFYWRQIRTRPSYANASS